MPLTGFERVALTHSQAWLHPVAVIRLYVGGLHPVGWDEGP